MGEASAVLKRRVFEALGFVLLIGCFLLLLMLLTYDPRDGSLNTAVDAPPHNFLAKNGAIVSDLLWQSLGFACFLIPVLLLAWALRLLLNRPVHSLWVRLALLPLILVLAALALSVLDLGIAVADGGSRRSHRMGAAAAAVARRAEHCGAADFDGVRGPGRPLAAGDDGAVFA